MTEYSVVKRPLPVVLCRRDCDGSAAAVRQGLQVLRGARLDLRRLLGRTEPRHHQLRQLRPRHADRLPVHHHGGLDRHHVRRKYDRHTVHAPSSLVLCSLSSGNTHDGFHLVHCRFLCLSCTLQRLYPASHHQKTTVGKYFFSLRRYQIQFCRQL